MSRTLGDYGQFEVVGDVFNLRDVLTDWLMLRVPMRAERAKESANKWLAEIERDFLDPNNYIGG